ncbi:3472_t:CDS:2 [Funneliformis geosporum]|uniref:3472_t:CDS:1 n=1 Tax=Funneliformis geosporum TaxID=1117311 RepID=A0A9W4SC17_9GLOM|nr:3472_t:CDS:2 [Funneliformis geosporum]
MSKTEANHDESLYISEMINSTDNINNLIDKLFILLVKIQNESKNFYETKHFLNKCITLSTRSTDEIFIWLNENQYESKYALILGIFYYYNMLGLDKDNNNEAYNLIKTANTQYNHALLYKGKGIEKNLEKAFYWYQKSAENNVAVAQLRLALLYKNGLHFIHSQSIIHQDFHSGNILCENEYDIVISDLGISKLSADLSDNNEFYCIISYTAPEIFQGKKSEKCTKASDIYSFGMIMWELMVGRRPFWDRDYDTLLIIDICDNIRPSIVTNAPKGYIEIMQECWSADPNKRPTTIHIWNLIDEFFLNEKKVPTKIILSSDIGPIIENEFIKDSYNEDYISKAFEFDI